MNKVVLILLFISGVLFANGFVTYEVDGKKYEGYYSTPSKNAPLVYLVHDWDGLTDYEVKRVKMLNDLGYAAFAVDLYGKGVKPKTIEEKKALSSSLYKDRAKMKKLLFAGLDEAKKNGANVNNAVGIGYCFGGAAILEFARAGVNFKKSITFHGGLKTPKNEDYSKAKGEIVVFHGSADKAVPISDFASLANELEAAKIKHEMILYSGTPHAFTIFGSKKYTKDADEKSWKRFTEILKATF
jgi:dienelactone hydrolase